MKRNVHLHGSLEKAAGQEVYRFDCDDQRLMFAGLRAASPALDIALRKAREVKLVGIDASDQRANPIDAGFQFDSSIEDIHIIPAIEGKFAVGALGVVEMIAAAVAVSYVTTLLMPKLSAGTNGAGGAKSTMFNGAINTTDQGGPIPIVYGKKTLVGSVVISVDVDFFNTLLT